MALVLKARSHDVQMSGPPALANATSEPTDTVMDSPSAISSNSATVEVAGDAGSSSTTATSRDDTCPACQSAGRPPKKSSKTTHWVECEGCGSWYHWDCVSKGELLSSVDKWYCAGCLQAHPDLKITYKPPARKSTRKRAQPSYTLHEGGSPMDLNKWMKIIETKPIAPDRFKRMNGTDVNAKWLATDDNALREPVVIEDPKGLGMRMPGWPSEDGPGNAYSFGVDDVAKIVGPETPVEVIDVATQSNSPSWDLKRWNEYYNTPAEERDKIRNVISLEVSGTPLAQQIVAPQLVREIDWFHRFWPVNKRGKGMYPKVQLYCLMSVANCWTDMHVDFAGSSVFYHVLRGSKVFYFIRPTKSNLSAYEKWCGSEMQSSTWLGDLVDEVVKVEVKQGHTMFIPTGWIHAVYTPVDSLVIGGNFLHSYNIATQLRVREIEIKTKVPKKFRFPLFQRMCWYACEGYNALLKAKEDIPTRVMSELRCLSDFLMSEARLIEGSAPSNADATRKEAKDMVPTDRVPDAPALAREFRWRLRLAMGGTSDDEGATAALTKPKTHNGSGRGKGSTPTLPLARSKRKRSGSDASSQGESIFRNFTPRPWTYVKKEDGDVQMTVGGVELPEDWSAVVGGTGVGRRHGGMERRTDSVVKLRRVDDETVEREEIRRVREVWRAGAPS